MNKNNIIEFENPVNLSDPLTAPIENRCSSTDL